MGQDEVLQEELQKVFWGQNKTSERKGKAEFLLLMAPQQ